MFRPVRIARIVSGGQTGADRAALDWAIANRVPHGGWCPRGRRAEDGAIDRRYRLAETPSDRYPQRTRRNVRDSDATLVFSMAPALAGGSAYTARCAEDLGKPWLQVTPATPKATIERFLARHAPATLNVAGPRASTAPDIGRFVAATLDALAASGRVVFERRELSLLHGRRRQGCERRESRAMPKQTIIIFYHNPRCSKSRAALELLRERGIEPRIVEYLRTPPSAAELRAIVKKLGIRPEDLVRKGETACKALKDRRLTDAEWIEAMVAEPILIERPIAVREGRAVIGRPPERVLELI